MREIVNAKYKKRNENEFSSIKLPPLKKLLNIYLGAITLVMRINNITKNSTSASDLNSKL